MALDRFVQDLMSVNDSSSRNSNRVRFTDEHYSSSLKMPTSSSSTGMKRSGGSMASLTAITATTGGFQQKQNRWSTSSSVSDAAIQRQRVQSDSFLNRPSRRSSRTNTDGSSVEVKVQTEQNGNAEWSSSISTSLQPQHDTRPRFPQRTSQPQPQQPAMMLGNATSTSSSASSRYHSLHAALGPMSPSYNTAANESNSSRHCDTVVRISPKTTSHRSKKSIYQALGPMAPKMTMKSSSSLLDSPPTKSKSSSKGHRRSSPSSTRKKSILKDELDVIVELNDKKEKVELLQQQHQTPSSQSLQRQHKSFEDFKAARKLQSVKNRKLSVALKSSARHRSVPVLNHSSSLASSLSSSILLLPCHSLLGGHAVQTQNATWESSQARTTSASSSSSANSLTRKLALRANALRAMEEATQLLHGNPRIQSSSAAVTPIGMGMNKHHTHRSNNRRRSKDVSPRSPTRSPTRRSHDDQQQEGGGISMKDRSSSLLLTPLCSSVHHQEEQQQQSLRTVLGPMMLHDHDVASATTPGSSPSTWSVGGTSTTTTTSAHRRNVKSLRAALGSLSPGMVVSTSPSSSLHSSLSYINNDDDENDGGMTSTTGNTIGTGYVRSPASLQTLPLVSGTTISTGTSAMTGEEVGLSSFVDGNDEASLTAAASPPPPSNHPEREKGDKKGEDYDV